MTAAPPARRTAAIAAAAGTGVQVGAAMVATRFVVHEIGPASLALLRYAIGVALLAIPALATRPRFARRDLLPIALLGIAQFGILIALLNTGLRTVPAGRGALIFATMPLMTMVLAAVLGHERLGAMKAAGVVLTIAGVAAALGEKVLAPGGSSWDGEVFVALSALSGAVASVFYRPYVQRYEPLAVSAYAMLASVAFLAVYAGVSEGFFAAWPSLSPGGWGAVAFIGASSAIGYVLWLYALGHAPATETTVFLALGPLTAIGLGALLLGEAVTPGALAGAVLVLIGLRLATRATRTGR